MINYLFVFTLTVTLFFFDSAFAYLDPGTGSIIIQAILGFIAAAITTISIYWNKLKIFVKKFLDKNKDKQ